MTEGIEEILHALDEEDDDQDQQRQLDNKSIKALRDWGKSQEKEAKRLAKEAEELRTFKTEALTKERKRTADEAFKALGLTEKQADLYLKLNADGEVTAETVKTFAEEYGFKAADETIDEKKEEQDQKPGWSPTVTGAAGGPVLSDAQYEDLLRTSPAQARQIGRAHV